MISVIIPLGEDFQLNALTIFSIEKSIHPHPAEYLFLQRSNKPINPQLIVSPSVKVVETEGIRYGDALNKAGMIVSQDSKKILIITPGTILTSWRKYERQVFLERKYGVIGLRVGVIRNPRTQYRQSFPSWQGMITETKVFKEIGGFDNYFPIYGGDFLYAKKVESMGYPLAYLKNKQYTYEDYSIEEQGLIELHKETFNRRLPRIMNSLDLKDPILDGWPGSKNE